MLRGAENAVNREPAPMMGPEAGLGMTRSDACPRRRGDAALGRTVGRHCRRRGESRSTQCRPPFPRDDDRPMLASSRRGSRHAGSTDEDADASRTAVPLRNVWTDEPPQSSGAPPHGVRGESQRRSAHDPARGIRAWGTIPALALGASSRRSRAVHGLSAATASLSCSRPAGEVAEWPKAQHWKCCMRLKPHRGFESPPLRSTRQSSLTAGRTADASERSRARAPRA